jgi:hypothetical protein
LHLLSDFRAYLCAKVDVEMGIDGYIATALGMIFFF